MRPLSCTCWAANIIISDWMGYFLEWESMLDFQFARPRSVAEAHRHVVRSSSLSYCLWFCLNSLLTRCVCQESP